MITMSSLERRTSALVWSTFYTSAVCQRSRVMTQCRHHRTIKRNLWPDVVNFTDFRRCHRAFVKIIKARGHKSAFTTILCVRSWISVRSKCVLSELYPLPLSPRYALNSLLCAAVAPAWRPYGSLIRPPRFGAQFSSRQSSSAFYSSPKFSETPYLSRFYTFSVRIGSVSMIVGRYNQSLYTL